MTDWGGATEELSIQEIMFKHSLGAKDPQMRAVEEIGIRLFKEKRKRQLGLGPKSSASEPDAKLLRLMGGGGGGGGGGTPRWPARHGTSIRWASLLA